MSGNNVLNDLKFDKVKIRTRFQYAASTLDTVQIHAQIIESISLSCRALQHI